MESGKVRVGKSVRALEMVVAEPRKRERLNLVFVPINQVAAVKSPAEARQPPIPSNPCQGE